MSLAARVWGALTSAPPEEGQATCFACAHFRNDPASIEAALPGLGILSSSRASVRADDGLCDRHDIFLNGRKRCDAFVARPFSIGAGGA